MPSVAALVSILELMAAPGPTNTLLAAYGAQSGSGRALIPVACGYGIALTAYAASLPLVASALVSAAAAGVIFVSATS